MKKYRVYFAGGENDFAEITAEMGIDDMVSLFNDYIREERPFIWARRALGGTKIAINIKHIVSIIPV